MRSPFLLAGLLCSVPVLLLPGADAVAADALPLLEWEGRHLPALPAAWRPVAESVLASAQTAAAKTSHWDPAAAARATTAFHVVGWALPRAPELPPEPAATGWWSADPDQVAAAAPLVTGWPGQRAVVAGDRLTLDHPRTPALGETTVEGMRLRLHGKALAACLKPLVGQQQMWTRILTAVAGWDLEATVDPDGVCRITTGIPLSALAPVDPAVVARLPMARWTLAFGIAPHPTDPEAPLLPAGTWAVAWNGGDHVVVTLPDGPAATAWLQRWNEEMPTTQGEELNLGGDGLGPWICRENQGWRLAFHHDDLTLPERGTSWPEFHGHLGVCGETSDDGESEDRLPWPVTGLEPLLGIEMKYRKRSWAHRLRGLAALLGTTPLAVTFDGDSKGRAVLTTRDGTLEGNLAGLLPALALRWFADEVADQHGMARLRGVLARLKAEGIPCTRKDVQAAQPVVPDAASWLARVEDWQDAWPDLETTGVVKALASTRLPLTVLNASELQAARDFGAQIAPLLALPADQIGSLPWQAAPADASTNFQTQKFSLPLYVAAHHGLLLVQHGDPAGLQLVDAARAALSRPFTWRERGKLEDVDAMRDEAWLTATIQGFGDPTHWLAEPFRMEEECRSAWAGELVLGRWRAATWLGTPQKTDMGWEGRHPLASTWDRTGTATNLAKWLEQMTHPDEREWDPDELVMAPGLAPYLLGATELLTIQQEKLVAGRIQHHLARLAAAIVLKSRRGPLPADAAGLGLPMTVPGPKGLLACAWLRLDDDAFRLVLKVRGPVPPGVPTDEWERWQYAPRPAEEDALVYSLDPPLIQVHQPAMPAPAKLNF